MASNPSQYGPLPGHPHRHTIILLHGRGSSGDEFATEIFESQGSATPETPPQSLLELFPTVRWVFPSAPERYSERFDEAMPQWFDMWATEQPQQRPEFQMDGLCQSVRYILTIVGEEEKKVSRKNIILGGISQGFATAVATFFADGCGFGGLVGICSWMPLGDQNDSHACEPGGDAVTSLRALKGTYFGPQSSDIDPAPMMATPVFLAHSAYDSIVPIEYGEQLRDFLHRRVGLTVEWHRYEDEEHWINEPQGIDDIA